MPKVFISHSWEDNEISRKLAEYLKRDGADIWIDYARISGGESLPRRLSEALEWCDTLVLLWSKSAENSYYVNLEWESALGLKKKKRKLFLVLLIILSVQQSFVVLFILISKIIKWDIEVLPVL